MKEKKIGIALSGGGFRAAVFQLGVLKYLAEKSLLENISHISTVSGGSIAIGLIYKLSNNKFPTSEEYLNDILPKTESYFTEEGLGKSALLQLLNPTNVLNLFNRANIIANVLYQKWNIDFTLQDISTYPKWEIGATTNETGKNWRFTQDIMGDYISGFVEKPNFRVSSAVAASAAFPGLIGRFKFDTNDFNWFEFKSWNDPSLRGDIKPKFETLHLSDGGVYDNLASEPFYKVFTEDEKNPSVDYIILCDASKPLAVEKSAFFLRVIKRTLRLVDITTDQIRMLRIRTIHKYLWKNKGKGLFLQLGQHKDEDNEYLKPSIAKKVKSIKTSIFPLKKEDYSLLINHAYAVIKTNYEKHGKV